jgi:hypothetical protein
MIHIYLKIKIKKIKKKEMEELLPLPPLQVVS